MIDHCGVEGIGAFCTANERIEHRNQNLRQISEAKCPRTFKPQTISHPQERKPVILKPVPLVKVIAPNKMIGTLLCRLIREFWLTDNI